jgi:hypothetical protein
VAGEGEHCGGEAAGLSDEPFVGEREQLVVGELVANFCEDPTRP